MKATINKNWREFIAPDTKAHIEAAYDFAKNELDLDRFVDEKLYIEIVGDIPSKKGIAYGDCTRYQYLGVSKIRLNVKYCVSFMLTITLFHELEHVRQYASGELKAYKSGAINWRGKVGRRSSVPYRKLPWEIEARKAELTLFRKWCMYRLKQKMKGLFRACSF